ncbi:hypothetical protein A0J61_05500 [Choanephora cucurbitarum]|uniref:Uncharacterized protein n=1 Tax=Choanephora cucurbitarum TaxID=101091 RepID=A0A1C7NBT7_9FUNG|nr:hypothetical protein A0J61_05500 [Choanephora cucurbitarum]
MSLVQKIRIIPFAQPVRVAEKSFEDYHQKGFFSAHILQSSPPKQSFLPFWVVSATVDATIEQAQVGRRVMRTRYNAATKRNESAWETDWVWVPEQHSFSRRYLPLSHPGLQIYGSYKHRRGLVEKITTGSALESTVPFAPEIVNKDADGVVRKVDPFLIYPSTALRLAKSYLHQSEEKLADEFLRKVYRMDDTRFLKINMKVSNIRVSPVYYPVYTFSVHYLGKKLHTFVNGHDLSIGGTKVYDWEKVAAASTIGMAATMFTTGGIEWGGASGSFWLGVVLPTLATSVLALYLPLITLTFRDFKRNREIKSMAQDSETWDENYVQEFIAIKDQSGQRTWYEEESIDSDDSSYHNN